MKSFLSVFIAYGLLVGCQDSPNVSAVANEKDTSPYPVELTIPSAEMGSDGRPVTFTLAVDDRGKYIAAGGDDAVVRIWDRATGAFVKSLRGEKAWVKSIQFVPGKSEHLVSGGYGAEIVHWNIKNGTLLESISMEELVGKPFSVTELAVRPQLKDASGFPRVTVAGYYEDILLLNPIPGEVLSLVAHSGKSKKFVKFDKKLQFLFSASVDVGVRIWSTANWQVQQTLRPDNCILNSLAITEDARFIVSGCTKRKLVVWQKKGAQWQQARTIYLSHSPTKTLLLSPDLVAVGSTDGIIRIFRLSDGALVQGIHGHTGSISSLAYDKWSKRLISGSFDTKVKAWDISSLF